MNIFSPRIVQYAILGLLIVFISLGVFYMASDSPAPSAEPLENPSILLMLGNANLSPKGLEGGFIIPACGYATPYDTPYGTPYDTPYGTPYDTPYGTPYDTPYGTPYDTPYGTPYDTPYGSPYASPGYTSPYASPRYGTPYGTPYATPSSLQPDLEAVPGSIINEGGGNMTVRDRVSFKGDVVNIGSADANGRFFNRFQITLNSNIFIDASAITLSPDFDLVNLNVGQTKTGTSGKWTARAGIHTLRFCADARGNITESNESADSNCEDWTFTVRPPAPTRLAGACPAPGNSATVSWSPVVSATYALRIDDLSNGWNGSCTSPNPGDICIDGLAPTSHAFPSVPGRTYHWWVHSIVNGAFSLAADGGNFTCPSLPEPDLIVTNIVASPLSPVAGTQMSFSGIVTNTGVGVAPLPSEAILRIDEGNDGSWNQNFPVTTGILASGASESEAWTNIWTAILGSHKYQICADNTNVVAESNESNNCTTSAPFTVSALATLTVSLSPNPIVGDVPFNTNAIPLVATVTSDSGGAPSSFSTYIYQFDCGNGVNISVGPTGNSTVGACPYTARGTFSVTVTVQRPGSSPKTSAPISVIAKPGLPTYQEK